MATYVALIRGIGPLHPNMRNAALATALRHAGCEKVRPALTSGNLVFESPARSCARLEARIERALQDKLQLSNTVIVVRGSAIEAMVRKDPFKGFAHGKQWYLLVVFRRNAPALLDRVPRAAPETRKYMTTLEKRHGKQITTRSWNSVLTIARKLRT